MNPITKVLRAPHAEQLEDPRGDTFVSAEDNVLTLESSRILSGRQEVAIRHNGRMYRLRCTRLGKLILTA